MKKKIRLDLSDLKVESFVTSEGMTLKDGTVFGMANTACEWTCNEVTETCDDGVACHGQSADCDWTTDQGALSCATVGTGTTLPPPPTVGDTCDDTCPETPDSCDGVTCQPE